MHQFLFGALRACEHDIWGHFNPFLVSKVASTLRTLAHGAHRRIAAGPAIPNLPLMPLRSDISVSISRVTLSIGTTRYVVTTLR
jgi:hypothetical protein